MPGAIGRRIKLPRLRSPEWLDRILKLGIAHVPEGRRVFKDLTVMENLRLGAYTRSDKAAIEQDLERRDLTINAMAKDQAGNLIDPYGGARDIEDRVLRHVSDAWTGKGVRYLFGRLGKIVAIE